jgi:hypothetical protein
MAEIRPSARSTGLLVRELPGEALAYDTDRHVAYCLNGTAALVLRLADGTRTPAGIARALEAETRSQVPETFVASALEQLDEAGLLEGPGLPAAPRAPARRQVLKRLGLGAVLLAPAVTSLVVPTPAEAAATCIPQANCQSGVNDGQRCYVSNQSTECLTYTCQGTNICAP